MRDENKTKKQLISELEEVSQGLAENALKEALQQKITELNSFLNNIPDMAWLKDIESRFIAVNKAFGEAVEMNPESLVNHTCEVCFGEEGAKKFQEDDRKVIERGKQRVIEEQIVDSRGREVWLETIKSPILDESGKVRGTVGIARDITKRKQAEQELRKAHDEMEKKVEKRTSELLETNEQLRREIENRKRVEEALRESEAYMRSILQAAPIGIGLVHNRVLDWVSDQMKSMLGYSGDELIGKSARIAYESDEEFERVGRDKYSEIQERGVGTVETRFRRKDGSVIDVLLCSSPVDPPDLSKGVIFTALDIKERKRAEEALRESEERFRELAELLPQPVFEMNLEANFTYGNRCGFETFGYNQDDMDKGLNALEMFVPEERERVQKNIRKTLTGEEFEDHEYTGLRKDGSTFPVLVYSAPIIKKDKPVGVRGIVLDITERKTFEEALRKSEERHRLFLQASPDPIVVYEVGGRATYINPAFERTFGWSSEELLGKRIDFVPEENWPETKAGIDRMLRGERIQSFETRRLTKAGRILDIQLSSSLFRDSEGKPAGNVVILRDVTEQKQAEEALEESVENFTALAENANDAILIAANEGAHVYANKRAAEITGYGIAELLQIGLHELTAPDEVEKVADRFKRRLNGENVPGQYETALVKKSGEIFPAELSSARSVWKGQPASIVIFRDISGRKQAEEVLRKRETDLELRTNELEEVNSALRVLLKRREDDKSDLEEKVLSNVKELVVPYVERLKKSGLDAKQGTYVNILESNLEDIVSPFVRKLSSTYLGLTPTEIHVANLVKEARDSKTIAQLLNMSPRTVESHRQNIRKKLGLKNKKANLRSHLMSIQ